MKRKTIEKAARKQLKGIVPCEWNQRTFIDIFVDAACWRINSVWHNPTDVPELDKYIIIIAGIKITPFIFCRTINKCWEFVAKRKLIECWAYVDDLLPTPTNSRELKQ